MQRSFTVTLALLAAVAAPSPSRASADGPAFEVTPLVGAWLPVGAARDHFEAAPLTGLQLAWDLHPHYAVVGTLSWAPTSAKRVSNGADVDVFQYDLGLRGQHAFPVGQAATVRPFVGIGVGQGRYEFRDSQYADGPAFAFYSAAGVELGYRALAAGFTARHQMTSLDASELGPGKTRHGVQLFTSVGIRF